MLYYRKYFGNERVINNTVFDLDRQYRAIVNTLHGFIIIRTVTLSSDVGDVLHIIKFFLYIVNLGDVNSTAVMFLARSFAQWLLSSEVVIWDVSYIIKFFLWT